MGGHMTLNKDRIFIWIQAAGNILCELLERAAAETAGVWRTVIVCISAII